MNGGGQTNSTNVEESKPEELKTGAGFETSGTGPEEEKVNGNTAEESGSTVSESKVEKLKDNLFKVLE